MHANRPDDRRYMSFEMRAADDPRYRDRPASLPERRRAYYAAEARKAAARKARDMPAFKRAADEARALLASLPA